MKRSRCKTKQLQATEELDVTILAEIKNHQEHGDDDCRRLKRLKKQKQLKQELKPDKKKNKRKRQHIVEDEEEQEGIKAEIIDEWNEGSTNIISSETKVKVKKSKKGSKHKKHKKKRVEVNEGESSTVFCPICYEKKTRDEIFEVEGCNHMFCKECVTSYVRVKILENDVTVKCPDEDCEFGIGPQNCKDIVPEEVIERWERVVCESAIQTSQKYYCPFKDCSALLVNDAEHDEEITASECPFCHRLFCAQCRVPWHGSLTCEAYRYLGKKNKTGEDIMLFELAKAQNWCRCRSCGFIVIRSEGCPKIKCRCGRKFCYECGRKWSNRAEDVHYYCRGKRTAEEKLRRART